MGAYRDFDAARAERQQEPLRFRFAGQDFTTTGIISAGALLDVAEAIGNGDDVGALAAFRRFFTTIVAADQRTQFLEACHSIDVATMFEMLAWVIEESTGRPLSNPSSSQMGSAPDGAPSRVVSLSAAATPST